MGVYKQISINARCHLVTPLRQGVQLGLVHSAPQGAGVREALTRAVVFFPQILAQASPSVTIYRYIHTHMFEYASFPCLPSQGNKEIRCCQDI